MKKRGRPTINGVRMVGPLSVLVRPETEALLRQRMAQTGESMSTVIRLAVEGWLSLEIETVTSKRDGDGDGDGELSISSI